jgi:hypothetical protein
MPIVPASLHRATAIGLACLGASALALPVRADVLPLASQVFALDYSTRGPALPPLTLNFAQFDPVLGTLTGVTFTFANTAANVGIQGSVTGMIDDAYSGNMAATFGATVGALQVVAGTGQAAAFCIITTEPDCQLLDVQAAVFTTPNPFGLATPGDNLAAFIGGGTFALAMSLTNINYQEFFDNLSGTAVPDAFATATWQGSVAVSYTYDAAPPPPPTETPEPASLALLGTALAMAGLLRRRRR